MDKEQYGQKEGQARELRESKLHEMFVKSSGREVKGGGKGLSAKLQVLSLSVRRMNTAENAEVRGRRRSSRPRHRRRAWGTRPRDSDGSWMDCGGPEPQG
jgi:hypothetical protein